MGEVLSELGPALAEPLARGHPGVLTALLGACRRHPGLQQEALRCLFQVGHAPFCTSLRPLFFEAPPTGNDLVTIVSDGFGAPVAVACAFKEPLHPL